MSKKSSEKLQINDFQLIGRTCDEKPIVMVTLDKLPNNLCHGDFIVANDFGNGEITNHHNEIKAEILDAEWYNSFVEKSQ